MTTYKVDKEHKTVYCTIETEGLEFYGKAKCAKEDTFDAEIGKKIAYAKAFMKVKKFDIRICTGILVNIYKQKEKLEKICAKNMRAYREVYFELQKLSK